MFFFVVKGPETISEGTALVFATKQWRIGLKHFSCNILKVRPAHGFFIRWFLILSCATLKCTFFAVYFASDIFEACVHKLKILLFERKKM